MQSYQDQKTANKAHSGWVWLGQAASGVLLVGLLGLHWVAQHYLASGGLRTFSDVVAYLKNPLALLLELSFLAVVTYHALLGLRAILLDLGPGRRLRQLLDITLLVLGTAILIYGVWLIRAILTF